KRLCGHTVALGQFAIWEPANSGTVADAGPDQDLPFLRSTGMATVTLNGAASFDPEDDEQAFEWSEGDAVLARTAVGQRSLAPGLHTLALKVTDSRGAAATDTTLVNVRNFAPAVSGGVQLGAGSKTLKGSYSDANGDVMSCAWSGSCSVQGSGCAPFTGTGGTSAGCSVRIPVGLSYCNEKLKCTDPSGASGSTQWNLHM